MKTEHGREAGTGLYCYTIDRPCRCGHSLDSHTAARVKVDGVAHQPCLIGDIDPDANCGCECFKPVPKARPKK